VYVQQMLKLSGAEMARGSGLTRSYISRVTTGKVNVGIDLLLYLATHHLVSIDWLLLGHGNILRTPSSTKEGATLVSQVQDLQTEVQSLREEMRSYSKIKPTRKG
jgi:transcriptional regulator with XRE-family HTH domain